MPDVQKIDSVERGRGAAITAPARKSAKAAPAARQQAKAAPQPHAKPTDGVSLSLSADADDASFESFSGNGDNQ